METAFRSPLICWISTIFSHMFSVYIKASCIMFCWMCLIGFKIVCKNMIQSIFFTSIFFVFFIFCTTTSIKASFYVSKRFFHLFTRFQWRKYISLPDYSDLTFVQMKAIISFLAWSKKYLFPVEIIVLYTYRFNFWKNGRTLVFFSKNFFSKHRLKINRNFNQKWFFG